VNGDVHWVGGKEGRVLDGRKFGLDRKGFFNNHIASPLGWFLVNVMMEYAVVTRI